MKTQESKMIEDVNKAQDEIRSIDPDQESCQPVKTSQTLYCENSGCCAFEEGLCMSTAGECYGHIGEKKPNESGAR